MHTQGHFETLHVRHIVHYIKPNKGQQLRKQELIKDTFESGLTKYMGRQNQHDSSFMIEIEGISQCVQNNKGSSPKEG